MIWIVLLIVVTVIVAGFYGLVAGVFNYERYQLNRNRRKPF